MTASGTTGTITTTTITTTTTNTITIKVLYFAFLREKTCLDFEIFTIPHSSTVLDLIEIIQLEYQIKLSNCLISRNLQIIEITEILKDEDELVIIPPVSGG
jgi:MoaE-MoaD fusion protein